MTPKLLFLVVVVLALASFVKSASIGGAHRAKRMDGGINTPGRNRRADSFDNSQFGGGRRDGFGNDRVFGDNRGGGDEEGVIRPVHTDTDRTFDSVWVWNDRTRKLEKQRRLTDEFVAKGKPQHQDVVMLNLEAVQPVLGGLMEN